MANAVHLRSTAHPEATRTGGRITVTTECGLRVDATLVDNESASCPDCNQPPAHGAERNRRQETISGDPVTWTLPDGGTFQAPLVTYTCTVADRWCGVCQRWIVVRGVIQFLLCPICTTPWDVPDQELLARADAARVRLADAAEAADAASDRRTQAAKDAIFALTDQLPREGDR